MFFYDLNKVKVHFSIKINNLSRGGQGFFVHKKVCFFLDKPLVTLPLWCGVCLKTWGCCSRCRPFCLTISFFLLLQVGAFFRQCYLVIQLSALYRFIGEIKGGPYTTKQFAYYFKWLKYIVYFGPPNKGSHPKKKSASI